jgi:hypothetical protein
VSKAGSLSQAWLGLGSGPAQVCSPTAQVEAATAQVQRRIWKLLISRFRRRITCFTTGISTLAHLPGSRDPTPPLLCPAPAPRRHLTRNRQLLTRARKVSPSARGPESVTTVHSQRHRQMRRLEPSPYRLRIFPLPSSHPSSHLSSLLSLRYLSHLSSKTFLSRSHSRYLHPRMQNSAHHVAYGGVGEGITKIYKV